MTKSEEEENTLRPLDSRIKDNGEDVTHLQGKNSLKTEEITSHQKISCEVNGHVRYLL